METYEARLATFVARHWNSRGHAQAEALATYGFYATLNRFRGQHKARCVRCRRHYRDDNYDHHWVLSHSDNCPFRQAALREDSSAQRAVLPKKPEPAQDQTALIDDLRERNQTLKQQVDALMGQNQPLQQQVEALMGQITPLQKQVDALMRQNQALEKEVEEYASVKAAVRTALGI